MEARKIKSHLNIPQTQNVCIIDTLTLTDQESPIFSICNQQLLGCISANFTMIPWRRHPYCFEANTTAMRTPNTDLHSK